MAKAIVSVHGDSAEAVAYALLVGVAHEEGKLHLYGESVVVKAPKDWTLTTYAECLQTVKRSGQDF